MKNMLILLAVIGGILLTIGAIKSFNNQIVVEAAPTSQSTAQAQSVSLQQPVTVETARPAQPADAWLAYTQTAIPEGGPMTGEQCAAAGAAAGWSATWGPATDGCWIISPDGQQTRHLGTWAGE